ncbi:MAG TPA: hypothetical protein VK796_05615 [Cytophaga sp.]|nr:hypothetical protein [Cytophaga sp.]
MSFQEELYYKIEAYLSGELDAGEAAAFENQISADDLLKAEVEKHKIANALIIEQRLLSVKGILQEERNKDSNSDFSSKPFGFMLLAVAAIGIGTSVYILNKGHDNVSSTKDENTKPQTTLTIATPENKKEAVRNDHAVQESSQQATADNDFRKQQIQQIEEHIHIDEKGSLYIDSSLVVKKNETNSSTSQTPAVKPIVPVVSDPCSNVSIQATIKTTPSCSHETTGTILVSNIQGGRKPYTVSIVNSHKEFVANGTLQIGVYNVYIMDANTCEKIYSNIEIGEKDCPINYSFNPFIGEKWSIESYRVEGQLEIYNKGGVLQYKETLDANHMNEWTGIGYNNQIIPGYYIFVIKYRDGTVRRGSVTIVQ